MALPIISTKLHIPQPPKSLVNRPGLISRLRADFRGKLILVSAPAGFGKTTLLSDWADNCGRDYRFCWVQLDESDNQAVRFLSYVIAALQSQHATLGEAALAGLHATPPAPPETVLASLVNEIDALDVELILVLDDYHLVDAPAIHQALSFLIDHIPPRFSLVLATRSDPPLPVHRWRARGQVLEIRADDLRFGAGEISSFLSGVLGTPLSPDDLAALDSRIEGWAAGYQMVALSIEGREDPHEFIATFSASHRFIMDFLSEEIFYRQPPEMQGFLLRTSILDRLCGPLCDALTGGSENAAGARAYLGGAQAVLEQLERDNLFLLPLDDDRQWFRYHRLFAELLRQRLRQSQPEDIPGLYRRATDWCAQNGHIEEAFRYALAAGESYRAADLVEAHALRLLRVGALHTLLAWRDRLPEEVALERPWLSVYFGWALLLSGNLESVEGYLEAAERGQVAHGDRRDLQGHLAAIRAYLASLQGDSKRGASLAREALELLPEHNLTVRSVVTFILGGINIMRGELPAALERLQEAGRTGAQAGNIHLAVSAYSAAGDILLMERKPAEAERAFNRALKLGTGRSGRPLPIAASVYSGLAEVHWGRHDLPQARSLAETGVELARQWGNMDSLVGSFLALAYVANLQGDTAEARRSLDQARQIAASRSLSPGLEERIAAYGTMIEAEESLQAAQGGLIEPLTGRELEVLALLARGLSNAEIASELVIALGTVKAHTSSIYGKLEARGRTEAVLKARELGLL